MDNSGWTFSYAFRGLDCLRLFAVEAKGAVSAPRVGRSIKCPVLFSNRERTVLKDIPFPVCLFFFTMEDDKGYYGWIKEPVVVPAHTPPLLMSNPSELKPLTNEELGRILSRIKKWYDMREAA
jgi:hypothetical protein